MRLSRTVALLLCLSLPIVAAGASNTASMPMAFNLFGEASLPEAVAARARLAELFGVGGRGAEVSDLVFEWSPGRRDPGTPMTGRHSMSRSASVIRAALERSSGLRPSTTSTRPERRRRVAAGPMRCDGLRNRPSTSSRSRRGPASSSRDGRTESWRPNCVSCGAIISWRCRCGGIRTYGTPQTRYVLVYPARNVSYRDAAAAHNGLLVDSDDSFQAATLESVAGVAFAPGSETGQRFRRRYLW